MNRNKNLSATGRRRFLFAGLVSIFAGFFGARRGASAESKAAGEPLTTRMRQGNPPSQPLDTMVLFERGDDNNGNAITHEVLSLIHEEKGKIPIRGPCMRASIRIMKTAMPAWFARDCTSAVLAGHRGCIRKFSTTAAALQSA